MLYKYSPANFTVKYVIVYHYWNSGLFFPPEIVNSSYPERKEIFDLLAGGIIPQTMEEGWITELTACKGLDLGELGTTFTWNLDISSSFG